ncbi:MAG: 3-phosphoglycerate dehydrogenase [Oscillospiraceae bacterium]|jgi:D-3-phosphoglycerate dehydrogenase|nr:3-phosphoglycerate dehydrogenase [Oscillospiraceae bacterium]
MFNILTLNKIAKIGTDRLGANFAVADDCQNPDAVMVRSASMHDMVLPKSLLAIARAGAGVNNIPVGKCSEEGIVVFNTPGANANAVKELVLAGLLLSSRNIVGGIEWAKTLKGKGAEVGKLVEKGKGQFVGPEITGKTIGIIGLGAIGILVANACNALGMKVIGYDPFLSVDSALKLSSHIKHVVSLDAVFAEADYITVHVPLNDKTKGMINTAEIAKMKDGVRILNYSRDGLVVSGDIIAALQSGKISAYVTDFATDDLLCIDGVIAMPHLGASTPESEDNCAVMAADEIRDYLEQGIIKNSVNFPDLSLAKTAAPRLCVFHRNKPGILQKVLELVAQKGSNVENMESKSKGDFAYTVIDIDAKNSLALEDVAGVADVLRVRLIG